MMNTTHVSRRKSDLSYTAFFFMIPVTFYWIVWSLSYFLLGGTLEGEIMMHSIIPRNILGLPVHLVVLLLTTLSLFCSVSSKLKRRTRWYRTPFRIRLAISMGIFFTFLIFLQYLM